MAFVPPSPTAASEHALQADPWEGLYSLNAAFSRNAPLPNAIYPVTTTVTPVATTTVVAPPTTADMSMCYPVSPHPGHTVPMITTQPSGQHARDGIDDTVLARQRQQIEALQRQLEQSQQAIRQLQLAMQPNALHDTTRAQYVPPPVWTNPIADPTRPLETRETRFAQVPTGGGQGLSHDADDTRVLLHPPRPCIPFPSPTAPSNIGPRPRTAVAPNGPRPRIPNHAYQCREPPTYGSAATSSLSRPTPVDSSSPSSGQTTNRHTATARSSLSRHSVPREPNAPFYSDSFYLYAAPYGPWLVNLTDENDAKVLERDDCIPRFAGEVHEDAFQWLQTFDDMAHANQWYSWDARVRMLPKYLESAALRWWHENRVYFQGWHNVEEDPMSISYFRGAFLTQFVQPALFIRWSQELHNAQQECGESATSYCTRIRQLVSRVCIQEELSETTIARRMLLGVMPKIAEAIVAHKRINGSWTITDVEAEIRRKARDLIQIYGKDVTTRPDGPIGASEPTDSQGHVLRNASRFIASLMPNRKTTRRPAPTRSNTSQSSRGSRSGNVSRRRNDARSKDDMSQLTKPMQKAILVLSNGRQLHVYENGTPVNACRRCGGHGHWQRDCTFDTDARKRNGLSLPPASQTTSSSDATVAPLSSTTGTSPIARPPRRVTRSATGLPDNARPSVVNKDSTVSARTTTKMSN